MLSEACEPRRRVAGGVRHIYLDLDGVVADFFGFARFLLGADYHSLPPELAWQQLGTVPNLYRNLPTLDGARDLFEMLSRLAPVSILSAMPLPTGYLRSAAADKRAWVAHHLSGAVQVITVCGWEQKALFAAPEDLLIDDSARNVAAWCDAGGPAIEHVSMAQTMRRLGDYA